MRAGAARVQQQQQLNHEQAVTQTKCSCRKPHKHCREGGWLNLAAAGCRRLPPGQRASGLLLTHSTTLQSSSWAGRRLGCQRRRPPRCVPPPQGRTLRSK